MKQSARLVVLALALSFAVVACGGDDSSSTPAEPGVVIAKDNLFEPKEITVKVGDTVTWRFEGNSAHNATFDGFHSKLMKEGTYEHTFDDAGSFKYRCTVHTGMNGKVVVK